jgi:hypothetical protein
MLSGTVNPLYLGASFHAASSSLPSTVIAFVALLFKALPPSSEKALVIARHRASKAMQCPNV